MTKNQETETKKTISQVLETLQTKSSMIRYLHSEGFSRSQISQILGIRYQHVRNVLITPLTGSK